MRLSRWVDLSGWVDVVAREVRHAGRRLARTPAFTIVAVLSLALGIGANTAAFGVLYAVLYRSLAVRDPGSLAVVQQRGGGTRYSMSYPAYAYFRDHATRAVEDVVAFRDMAVNVGAGAGVSGGGDAAAGARVGGGASSGAGETTELVTGMLVSGNYFAALGINMVVGSPITAEDDRIPERGGSRGPVAVLSEQFWSRRFNRDPGVIGRMIRVQGEPLTVIGVVPGRFRGTRVGALPDVFIPMMFAPRIFHWPNTLTGAYNHWLRIIIRKRPDVAFPEAEAEMTVVYRQFNRAFAGTVVLSDQMRQRVLDARILLEPGRAGLQEMRDQFSSPLFILMALMALVWLIAAVNVAGLMVARAVRQLRDAAIHLSLGASRTRLWSQHLVESALLGAAGVALGLVFANWMRGLLVQLVPPEQQLDLRLDELVIAATLLLGAATIVILGAITAWQSTRRTILDALKGDDITTRLWLRRSLIVGQLALSIVVLAAAALFGQTLRNLRNADTGFDREHVLMASLSPSAYPAARQRVFYDRLLDALRATPGVLGAALSNDVPLDIRTGWTLRVSNEITGAAVPVSADISFVSSDFFKTLAIPFVAGRDFDPDLLPGDPQMVLVNETFVRQYLPTRNPIGARVSGNGDARFEVRGVVKDSATRGFRQPPEPLMYVPLGPNGLTGNLIVYLRSAVPPASLAATIEAIVHRDDPDVPIRDVRTIDQYVDLTIGRERTFASLTTSFGLLALILSAIGLYGMLAYAVSRRTKELGIRLALGANPQRLVRMVLREALILVICGLVAGMPLAMLLGGTIRSLLYGVQPGDWFSLTMAGIVLLGVGLCAAWLPARRAAGVDPLTALRHE